MTRFKKKNVMMDLTVTIPQSRGIVYVRKFLRIIKQLTCCTYIYIILELRKQKQVCGYNLTLIIKMRLSFYFRIYNNAQDTMFVYLLNACLPKTESGLKGT